MGEILAVQVLDELRRADQVVDAQPDVHRALQAEQVRALTVEPDDFMLAAEDDHPVRQRRGGAAQFPEDLHQALLVELLAPVQAHHLADDVAPHPPDVGRGHARAQPQPAVDAVQIEQLPAEIEEGGGQSPEPRLAEEQSERRAQRQNARQSSERKGPHRNH